MRPKIITIYDILNAGGSNQGNCAKYHLLSLFPDIPE